MPCVSDVQVWSLIPCSSHFVYSKAAAACYSGPPSGFPQHLQHSQTAHFMSASVSAMLPAAQQCSGRAAHSPSMSVQPLSALMSECSAKSESCARQAAQVHHRRLISSSAAAADSMSRDKTDLNAGAAAAAAAQTMQQQPSAHGLQAAPQVAKVLGFAGAALPTFSSTLISAPKASEVGCSSSCT